MRSTFWTALLFATITAGLAAQSDIVGEEGATCPAEDDQAHGLCREGRHAL